MRRATAGSPPPIGSRGARPTGLQDSVIPSDDRALLDLALDSLVAQNKAQAARLEAISRFHANRVAEAASPSGSDAGRFFALTPLQATKAEFGPLLVIGETMIEADLDLTDALKQWFPRLWGRCLEGRLDVGRARLAYNQLVNLTSEADKLAFARLVEDYLEEADDPSAPMCPIGWRRFAQAVRRRCLKFPQRDEQDTFAEAFRRRRVGLRVDDTGIGTLSVTTAVTDLVAADYRLTLIARKLREAVGETRTLEQLRVDALVDLIHGRLTVGATTGELEDDHTGDADDPSTTFTRRKSVGAYARPVINVTVPITTLMGLTDTPGMGSGDLTIPADLARRLAVHPEATWWRLLTDPEGRGLELSTTGYTPTAPIARWVVARDRTCVWPGCTRPSSACELDHRAPYPDGATCTCNLQPLCRRHHQVKHSDGFELVRNADGSYTWTSRFGSVFTTPAPEHPTATWPHETRVAEHCMCDASDALHRMTTGRGVGSVIEQEFRTWLEQARVG